MNLIEYSIDDEVEFGFKLGVSISFDFRKLHVNLSKLVFVCKSPFIDTPHSTYPEFQSL